MRSDRNILKVAALLALACALLLGGCKVTPEQQRTRFKSQMDRIDAKLARWDAAWKVQPAAVRAKKAEFEAEFQRIQGGDDEATAKSLQALNRRVSSYMTSVFGAEVKPKGKLGTRATATGGQRVGTGARVGSGLKPATGGVGGPSGSPTMGGMKPATGTMGGMKPATGTMGGMKPATGTMGGMKPATGTMGGMKPATTSGGMGGK